MNMQQVRTTSFESKFHLVDLAGSERVKRSGVTGQVRGAARARGCRRARRWSGKGRGNTDTCSSTDGSGGGGGGGGGSSSSSSSSSTLT
jgi:hypothetical protein